jgi:hypothetical protein
MDYVLGHGALLGHGARRVGSAGALTQVLTRGQPCLPLLSPFPRYMGLWLAALGGSILKLDHSFKVVRRVRDGSGERQFSAVLTIMNEFCQVGSRSRRGSSSSSNAVAAGPPARAAAACDQTATAKLSALSQPSARPNPCCRT